MTSQDEVAALRRQVRVLWFVALTSLVVAGVGMWRGSAKRAEEIHALQVEAQEFRLLDPNGALRGLWRCPPAGPAFTLLEENGRVAIELRESADGGGSLMMRDADGKILFQRP